MKCVLLCLFSSLLMVGAGSAEPQENPAKPVVESVENAEWIKAHLDQEVTVKGVPNAKSSASAAGHFFYNFDRSDLTLFCFKAVAATLPDEKKPGALVGKTIQVTGKLALYKDKPQIVIRKAEQIVILEQTPAADAAPKKEVE
jgi:DNA/RNA endonuclease YhcR with UshA esterase domain